MLLTNQRALEGGFNAHTACAPQNAACPAKWLTTDPRILVAGIKGEQDFQANAHGTLRVSIKSEASGLLLTV